MRLECLFLPLFLMMGWGALLAQEVKEGESTNPVSSSIPKALQKELENEMEEDSGPSSLPVPVKQVKKAKPVKVRGPIPEDIKTELDVPYLGLDRKELADLYLPQNVPPGQKAPALIIIHGGGFNDGDRWRYREMNFATNAAKRGYLAMSIDYKLRKMSNQVTWPQNIHDGKEAVRWLKLNADKYNLDPERIGAMGGSAGGNMAAMLALTRPEDGFDGAGTQTNVSTKIVCGIDLYGAVDLMTYHDMKMFAKTREEAPELYKKGSPTSYVRSDSPPLLMIHGTGDPTVKVDQSQKLMAKLLEADSPCAEYTIRNQAEVDGLKEKIFATKNALILIPEAPHTFDLQVRMKKDAPIMMDITELVFAWLDRHLQPKAGSKKL